MLVATAGNSSRVWRDYDYMHRRRLPARRIVLAAIAAISLFGLAACAASGSENAAGVKVVGGQLGPWDGDPLDPPTPKPHFTLTDTSGNPYNLTQATAGKITLLYFGYTHCPDICPLLMSNIAEALHELPAKISSQVDVVFVTVDPARDTRPVLRAWLDAIDPTFVGLTGSIQQIVAAEKLSGVPTATIDAHDTNGYTVLHSAEVLAFGHDNEAHLIFDSAAVATDMVHDIKLLAKGTT